MEEEKRTSKKKKKVLWIISSGTLVIILIWFGLAVYNYYRVNTERRPILCFGNTKEIEANNEYSKVCHGIFYKYKEYYEVKSNTITAREYTLFFKEFDRKS